MGQGTTPAIPAHGPGASLDHASLSLFSTLSIVLGGSLRYRWPPDTSIPAGSVPILGHSRPASESRASPCRSAGDSLLHLGSRVAAGRGPCSGDEGDLPFPILTARCFVRPFSSCYPWLLLCHQLSAPPHQGYLGEERVVTEGRVPNNPPPQPATNPRSSPARATEPLAFTSPASPSSLSSW